MEFMNMVDTPGEMGIFQRVIERGSFAGAAADLGLSPSAVSKLITRLELRLGARLINRTTRRLALTHEGEVFLQRSRDILRAIEAAEAEIASTRVSPRGHLRVHAFPTFAVDHLCGVLPDFLARYPRITFDFLVTNRSVDLLADNIDVALRVGHLNDSTMVARRIANLTQVVCASPKYLARHGRPAKPSELQGHACLTLSHIPGANKWTFRTDDGPIQIEVKGPVAADSAHMLLRLAIEGVGIIRFGDNVVATAIREGLLEPLLQDWQEPEGFPLWAILPPGRQRTPKVKVFLDFLIERFGPAPWRSKRSDVRPA
jgi:DNA-binding transcriptional LysR family regulator